MRIVLGVLEPDAGSVTWDDRPATTETRAGFGYMPEERGLYPKMRVGDQLAYMARLHGLDAATARAAAGGWIDRLGLSDRASTRVEELSLGNQQRVQLGAALVHSPTVLVLDEPFSGLDPGGVDVLAEVLAERARDGAAVVFSSHQLELVERVCDAVSIINRGRLVASGDVAELRARHGERRLEVEVEDAPPDWWRGVPGVREAQARNGAVALNVEPGGDDQRILAAATAAGRVRRFGYTQPTLAEVFREAVAG
jgi:ABC-2 type transport system ATP-binding protein